MSTHKFNYIQNLLIALILVISLYGARSLQENHHAEQGQHYLKQGENDAYKECFKSNLDRTCWVAVLTNSTQKPVLLNVVNQTSRLPLMSATFIDETNFGNDIQTSKNYWKPYLEDLTPGVQPFCLPAEDYSDENEKRDFAKRNRGHLTSTFGNRYSTQSIEDVDYCINVAPQDKFMADKIWPEVEKQAINRIKLSGYDKGYIVTGTCQDKLEISTDPFDALPVPSCFWKIICTSQSTTTNKTMAGGWIGRNQEPAIDIMPQNKSTCDQMADDALEFRSVLEVLEIAGQEEQRVRDILIELEKKLSPSEKMNAPAIGTCFEALPSNIDLASSDPCVPGKDLTTVPMEHREQVTRTVVDLLKNSLTIPQDYEFIFRAAMVSDFGRNPNTFKDEYFGGIWRITEEQLARSKSADAELLAQIKTAFNIDWKLVVWQDMLIPLHSGIAFALTYTNHTNQPNSIRPFTKRLAVDLMSELMPLPIPLPYSGRDMTMKDILDQYYEEHSNRGKFNLVVVLDGSGSISSNDYKTATIAVGDFLFNLTQNSQASKLGLVTFGSSSKVEIDLENSLSPEELKKTATGVTKSGGGTATHLALLNEISLFKALGETSVPSVCIVLTDGQSDSRNFTTYAAEQAQAEGILHFGVGIGTGINADELAIIAGDPRSVFELDNFDNLLEMPLWLNVKLESLPTTPVFDEFTNGSSVQNEIAYFEFELPADGLTLEVFNSKGKTAQYYSFTHNNPTDVYHDGVIGKGLHHILPSQTKTTSSVFVSVMGLDLINEYNLVAHDGFVEGCGFKGILENLIEAKSLNASSAPGTVVWFSEMYGYEGMRSIQNSLYVQQVIENGQFQIITKPRLSEYIKETGLSSMDVTASFSCPGEDSKDYVIKIPITA